jgi:hypothetical protein
VAEWGVLADGGGGEGTYLGGMVGRVGEGAMGEGRVRIGVLLSDTRSMLWHKWA